MKKVFVVCRYNQVIHIASSIPKAEAYIKTKLSLEFKSQEFLQKGGPMILYDDGIKREYFPAIKDNSECVQYSVREITVNEWDAS